MTWNLRIQAVAWCCVLLLTGCKRAARETDTLTVGMELSYPPFEMSDIHNKPAGISVDLAYALGNSLRKKIEIENLPFDGLIVALKTGKIDLIISSLTATPERLQSIDFSDPYWRTGLCMLIAKDSAVNSINDLDRDGCIVVAKRGTTGFNYALEHLKKAHVNVLESNGTCLLEVSQGKADAFLYDQLSVFNYWRQNLKTTRVNLRPFEEGFLAIGIRKGDSKLREQVNTFLKNYREQNGFEQLSDKWLKNDKDAFKEMGVPFYF